MLIIQSVLQQRLSSKFKKKINMRVTHVYKDDLELDIYTPSSCDSIIVMIHGGAFMVGNKSKLQPLDSYIAEMTRSYTVTCNYTLSPPSINVCTWLLNVIVPVLMVAAVLSHVNGKVVWCIVSILIAIFIATLLCVLSVYSDDVIKQYNHNVYFPQQLYDIASAIRYARDTCGKSRIYLLGHSAGAHLVSMIALDPQYLHSVGLSPYDIAGVVSVSGIYSPYRLQETPMAAWVMTHSTMINAFPLTTLMNKLTDADISHVPPFLLFSAELDISLLRHSHDFAGALYDARVPVKWHIESGCNHITVMKDWNGKREHLLYIVNKWMQQEAM